MGILSSFSFTKNSCYFDSEVSVKNTFKWEVKLVQLSSEIIDFELMKQSH